MCFKLNCVIPKGEIHIGVFSIPIFSYKIKNCYYQNRYIEYILTHLEQHIFCTFKYLSTLYQIQENTHNACSLQIVKKELQIISVRSIVKKICKSILLLLCWLLSILCGCLFILVFGRIMEVPRHLGKYKLYGLHDVFDCGGRFVNT